MVAVAVPTITSTYDNNQKQEEMNPFIMDKKPFLEASYWPDLYHMPFDGGNGIA